MYTKHFLESDFLSGTTMRGGECKNRKLEKSAIPSLFPDYPPLAQTIPVEKRSTTMSTRQARQDSANKRIWEEVDEFLAVGKVSFGRPLPKTRTGETPNRLQVCSNSKLCKTFPPSHFLCTNYYIITEHVKTK